MEDASERVEIVRVVEIGRPIAVTDQLVITVTPNGKDRVRIACVCGANCGADLIKSRLGKARLRSGPRVRRM